MSKKLYPQVHAGEKVEVKWRKQDYKMACCDCGLVHRLRFNVKGGTLIMRGWRENRSTGQIRRRMLSTAIKSAKTPVKPKHRRTVH